MSSSISSGAPAPGAPSQLPPEDTPREKAKAVQEEDEERQGILRAKASMATVTPLTSTAPSPALRAQRSTTDIGMEQLPVVPASPLASDAEASLPSPLSMTSAAPPASPPAPSASTLAPSPAPPTSAAASPASVPATTASPTGAASPAAATPSSSSNSASPPAPARAAASSSSEATRALEEAWGISVPAQATPQVVSPAMKAWAAWAAQQRAAYQAKVAALRAADAEKAGGSASSSSAGGAAPPAVQTGDGTGAAGSTGGAATTGPVAGGASAASSQLPSPLASHPVGGGDGRAGGQGILSNALAGVPQTTKSGGQAGASSTAGGSGGGGGDGAGGAPIEHPAAGAIAAVQQASGLRPKEDKGKIEEYRIAFGHFFRIFTYATVKDRIVIGCSVVASLCTGMTMPLMTIVFATLIRMFTSYYDPFALDAKDKFTKNINTCVLYMVYLFIGRLVFDYIAILGFRMLSLRLSAAIRLDYLRALFAQPISVLDSLPPGQTAAIITTTAAVLQAGIGERLSVFLSSLSMIVASVIIAFVYSWKLTLVTCAGLVLILGVYAVTVPMLAKRMAKVQAAEIKASTVASEALGGVRMVAACGAEEKMAARQAKWVDEAKRLTRKMGPLVGVQQAPVFFAIFGTMALCFWYAVRLYMALELVGAEALVVVLMSVMMVIMSIGGLAGPLTAAARAAGSAAIFFTIIDQPTPVWGNAGPDDGVDPSGDLELCNVSFTYPRRLDVRVLAGVSVKFEAGKTTAIVGASGAGKSTIVGLIERWYELYPDEATDNRAVLARYFRNGHVTVGSGERKHRLQEIDLRWWRAQIGLVQQEPFLFNESIFRNVAYGLIGTPHEHADEATKRSLVEEACREAYADEFIRRLPDGYDTVVGDSGGLKLSGGQRQRIAIARAIVRKPAILILDEATSAIDVRSERIVQRALDRASVGRTTIVIAHRLSTIRRADKIVVLRRGQVVQQGTHEELMRRVGGVYWALASAQSLQLGAPPADGGDEDGVDEKHKDSGGAETEHIDLVGLEKGTKDLDLMIRDDACEGSSSSGGGAGGKDERKPQGKSRGFFRTFFPMLWEQRRLWKWYVIMMAGAVGAGASAPVQAYLFANLITVFQFWGDILALLTSFWCLMVVALAASVGISYFALSWASTLLSAEITSSYRKEYFANILAKPIAFFDEDAHSVGALTAVLATDPTQLNQLLGTNMAFVVISVLNVVGCVSIALYFGWKLTLVTLCSSLPLILAAGFYRIRYEMRFERANYAVFAESARFATESIGAIRTVSALTLEATIIQRYETLLRDHVRDAFRRARYSTIIFSAADSIALLCMAFVLWYGGTLLANFEYVPFQYLVVYIAVVQGGLGAGQWLSFGPNVAQAVAAANRIQATRHRETDGVQGGRDEDQAASLDEGKQDAGKEKGGGDVEGVRIDFQNVWFRYPTRDAPVLNGLDLTIEKGQFAAIVGPSGAGKTSVISLIERFYTPKSGSITLDDADVSSLPLRSYRASLSLVAQEPSLFDGTIRQNILLGLSADAEAAVTDAQLHEVARAAGLHDFVSSLPEGYETPVGIRGIMLSGGQRQRVAIARALIRNPRLLLLDEATASLDSETERQVQGVFERTKGKRTMVVVAHRLATVQNADVIFVLGDGKVLEKGTHAQLLGKKGLYYQMCLSQALDR